MYKLRPETLAAWASAMRRLPPRCNLKLLQFQRASVPRLHGELAALGLAATRLRWLPMRPRAAHVERARTAALLALDTPGYNGGTSGLDALWSGMPLVRRRKQPRNSDMDTWPSLFGSK